MKKNLKKIKILFTDCDGVLTDSGVYYGKFGEELKKYSLRDGMGVERLFKLKNIETAIITGEKSESLIQRSKKLKISKLFLGIKNKVVFIEKLFKKYNITWQNIAYIGDDLNDLDAIIKSGLSACPSDAMDKVKDSVDIVLNNRGGNGCFREFCEILINEK